MGLLQERHGWTSCAPREDQSHQVSFPLLTSGAPWPQQPQKPQLRVEGKKSQCDITEAEENGKQGLCSRTVCKPAPLPLVLDTESSCPWEEVNFQTT